MMIAIRHWIDFWIIIIFFLFEGVIATHKITASSPDTDLPTVQGLRVGNLLN